jgi:hypothetical protein
MSHLPSNQCPDSSALTSYRSVAVKQMQDKVRLTDMWLTVIRCLPGLTTEIITFNTSGQPCHVIPSHNIKSTVVGFRERLKIRADVLSSTFVNKSIQVDKNLTCTSSEYSEFISCVLRRLYIRIQNTNMQPRQRRYLTGRRHEDSIPHPGRTDRAALWGKHAITHDIW